MGRTAGELTDEERRAYRRGLLRLSASKQADAKRRAGEALAVAQQCAAILRREFGVRRVWLFGSLARGTFGPGSDVDLAVDAIDEGVFLRALGRLLSLRPDLPVDLVDLRHARAGLRAAVEKEGIPL
ncbi:nucleotidyltransferase domain-containing protein [Carboxydochorda subterranea]|uniref:Nucleotidyltransferase domain-containing protein n=1 Tax=Carboxydichorda subterranea TaxID=3109565 RepID=A0ABZ1BVR2_9FIRM|nr:nucleotidyltransferase domain-containing protein [Limnochorda sp. L945t]WRP16864.1 nucleotidyltransferase domain-containing protein [Limnochorda sp. L945t]